MYNKRRAENKKAKQRMIDSMLIKETFTRVELIMKSDVKKMEALGMMFNNINVELAKLRSSNGKIKV